MVWCPNTLWGSTVADWESKFELWSKPPGTTEQQRCENAEKAIRNAINKSEKLNHRNIRVFTQGSYRNRVNVRKDSDVDIGILCFDVFFDQYPEGKTRESFGYEASHYTYPQFKNEVGEALVSHFGTLAVTRGSKAFDIKENSYHVEADVAPFFEHRRFDQSGNYQSGVELRPDDAVWKNIINWPEQHYENGVAKNNATSRRYKGVVRILKTLRSELDTNGIAAAKPIPSFLVECLVWNVPNENLLQSTWRASVRSSLAYLWNNTRTDDQCSEWGEVSELKYLFRGAQPWTRQQAHGFIDAAWNYLGFE